ncbi:deferrochelatase/peroxidase EfeB [Methylobacterium sp. PvP062]|jgi:deferrochelatase/peroxidase EfeB|uniref:Deferrochelatase n=2 Tax=Methylobacterium radiotolerans TaxID=31998 RepID=B1M7V4_METRJ|nr:MULTISPECIES: iron uptake transporter deferrochelatase/peroxidase subunit [Methylobacterium]MCX7335963.1 iron uptake transporter deferrochelatase/peroxidase subunit [Hyphomicrobiales bacterium]GAN46600.1 putative peroxidase [Methylobacterium sp. ME121]ACB25257.1 Dyp-type peroxidase family [Methylobacterium radiotolerans JCM 2831]KIU32091.1 peroxidase [Methylobacterium radiotolerans]MBN6818922.1 deferrochelatase/peroxidase EfeB [Methylobacterium organophilum]
MRFPSPVTTRRRFLGGFGAAALLGPARAEDATPTTATEGTLVAQPFYGPHQAGIVTPQPAAALYVAFDVLAERRGELPHLFRTLTERLAFLTRGGAVPDLHLQLPPRDSGILGPTVLPDNLTATVSVGASLFDYRFGLARARPRHLGPMERFPNDALDPAQCHGDLLIQFCSNTAETNIHALRDVIKATPGLLTPRWKIEGFLPPHVVKTMGADTVRNMLGFKDGTANLDVRDPRLMDRYVWVGAGQDEPAWTAGGSYQVVRIIRTLVERWDRTPLGEQEAIIGRHKGSGAPLRQGHEREVPDYAADPDGEAISLAAHIRLANPRLPGTEGSLILRRSYNYSRGLTAAGQLDMGLLFVCYQADLSAGFITVQNRLSGEGLEEYIRPTGGGYFFALPGVPGPEAFLGEGLLAAV